MWPHSYNSHVKSLLAWDGELWAAPDVVPSLVLELARSQLRSLLAEAYQASLVSEVEEEDALRLEARHLDVVDERP